MLDSLFQGSCSPFPRPSVFYFLVFAFQRYFYVFFKIVFLKISKTQDIIVFWKIVYKMKKET